MDDFLRQDLPLLRSKNTITIRCWVYLNQDKPLEVFTEKKDNTEEVWLEFFEMNHVYWDMIDEECIEECFGVNERDKMVTYNDYKVKMFYIRYLLKGWSFSTVLKRKYDGSLTDESFKEVLLIHPRILRIIFSQYNNSFISEQEEGDILKQCHLLFGQGQGVSSPHKYISLYCDLVTFWDKFGLNFGDIQKLPQEVYKGLRKIVSIENQIRSAEAKTQTRPNTRQGQNKQIRF